MLQLGWTAPHAGLALATSLSSFINAGLLYRGLKKAGVYSPQTGWMKLFIQTGFAVTVMGIFVYLAAGELSFWTGASASQRILQLSWIIPLGAASYFVVLWLSGVRFSQLQRPNHN
jgi:putative peptidoglycan lipid II flippase